MKKCELCSYETENIEEGLCSLCYKMRIRKCSDRPTYLAHLILESVKHERSVVGRIIERCYGEEDKRLERIENRLAAIEEKVGGKPGDMVWWCTKCKIEVPPAQVTYEEKHVNCGWTVIWVEQNPKAQTGYAEQAKKR